MRNSAQWCFYKQVSRLKLQAAGFRGGKFIIVSHFKIQTNLIIYLGMNTTYLGRYIKIS